MQISVLIPCYNASLYIADAILSALAQQPAPLELLVVDDGSSDLSAELVAGQFGSRVRLVRQEHLGIAATRNRCLHEARGDTIAFLDADDLWTSGSLRTRVALLERNEAIDIAAGAVEQFISPELDEPTRRTLSCPPGASQGRLAGAMLIRRRVFNRVGEFDTSFRLGETLDWMARAESCGTTIESVRDPVLRRRIHATNTGSREKLHRSDYLHVLKASIDRRREAIGRQQ